MSGPGRAQRAIAAFYSWAADRIYEPVIVGRAFPLLGGDLGPAVEAQGRAAVARAEGRPILDLPVGTAYFTLAMARLHSGLVVGADIAAGMVRAARRAAQQAGLANLAALRCDVHRLPFPDGSFGAVLCTNGLQVIPGLNDSLQELARVLAPGASLYLSVITLPLTALLPRSLASRAPTVLKARGELLEALAQAGLTVASVKTQRLAVLIEARRPLRP